MLSADDITLYTKYAAISQFLAAKENADNKVFNGGSNAAEKRLPTLLYMINDTVGWAKDYYEDTDELDLVSNYMYSLCGKYIGKAKQLIGNPAGEITMNPTTGLVSLSFPKIQFKVGPSALMHVGDTELIITANGIQEGSFEITADGIEVPMLLSDRLSYAETPVLTTPNGTKITFNQPLLLDQVIIIKYEKVTSI